MKPVTIIGGGLAGCEAALQLSSRKIPVRLLEMRPSARTGAHRTDLLAELVCSNSLKSRDPLTASGLLKEELSLLGCALLPLAESAALPAGHALAVDRDEFASAVTARVSGSSFIQLERKEQRFIPDGDCVIVASGPLTSDSLSSSIEEHFGAGRLFFYDAISISVESETVDESRLFRASRYGKGGDDYLNVPLSRGEYDRLVEFLLDAPRTEKRGFESGACFEACLPVEVIAGRGRESLRYGPLKPRGLKDPSTGREPYAALQLRQEKRDGSMLGLVGFQTRLTRAAQKMMLSLLPGLEKASVARWGAIHRNTYLDSPRLLDASQMSLKREGLFFSGQITGVEGYVESIAHGLLTALYAAARVTGRTMSPLPGDTISGALQAYLSGGESSFQPMNANMGLLPPVKGGRRERKALKAKRSLDSLRSYLAAARLP